ncbi:MAG: terminase small subunit [gamma proteobacterium symbiont of Taylorina sp.]|nr:terminase small subunit [gamma proteobacterium symbiont of Taylorina sp.]
MSSKSEPSYPVSFYAQLFKLSERRIQQLAKDKIIPKEVRGMYPLIGTVRGYVLFLQGQELSPEGGSSDYQINRNRLIAAQADAQEMKNKVDAKTYAPVVVIESVIGNLASKIVSLTDSIPIKIKSRLPHLKSKEIDIVKREVIKIRNEASKIEINWDEISGAN